MEDWRDSYPEAIRSADMFSSFEELSARIQSDEKPVVIESRAGDVVMLSAAVYRSIMETLHVFSSPANAKRLIDSIEKARRG